MIAVARLGFRTCRGSACSGGLCWAHFSFSPVAQACGGQGREAHRTRSERSGARLGRAQPRPARLLRSRHLLLEAHVAFRECARRVVHLRGRIRLALSPATSCLALTPGRFADTPQTSAQLATQLLRTLQPTTSPPAIVGALLLGTSEKGQHLLGNKPQTYLRLNILFGGKQAHSLSHLQASKQHTKHAKPCTTNA